MIVPYQTYFGIRSILDLKASQISKYVQIQYKNILGNPSLNIKFNYVPIMFLFALYIQTEGNFYATFLGHLYIDCEFRDVMVTLRSIRHEIQGSDANLYNNNGSGGGGGGSGSSLKAYLAKSANNLA